VSFQIFSVFSVCEAGITLGTNGILNANPLSTQTPLPIMILIPYEFGSAGREVAP